MPTPPTSDYWLKREGTGVSLPYRTPICHKDYRMLLPAEAGLGRRIFGALFGSSQSENQIAQNNCKVEELYFENSEAGRGLALRSKSFRNGDEKEGRDVEVVSQPPGGQIDAVLYLPLECDAHGVPQQRTWTQHTSLVFVLDNAAGVKGLTLSAFPYGGGGATIEAQLDLRLMPGWSDATFHHATQSRYKVRLDQLATAATLDLDQLVWNRSPYKIQVTSYVDDKVDSTAWTYVHVPVADEVRFLEDFATQRMFFKRDAMGDFAALGTVTQPFDTAPAIQGVVENPPAADAPFHAAEAHLFITDDEKKAVQGAIWHPLLGPQERDLPRRAAAARQIRDSFIREKTLAGLEKDRERITERKAVVQALLARGTNYADAQVHKPMRDRYSDYDQNKMNLLIERGGGAYFLHLSWGVTIICRRDAGTGRYWLERLYIADYMASSGRCLAIMDAGGNLASCLHKPPPTPRGHAPAQPVPQPGPAPAATAPAAVQLMHGLVPTTARVQGPIYSTTRGRMINDDRDWAVFDFQPMQIPLAQAITYGVSACCAVTTFTNDPNPEAIVFSHIDGSVFPPDSHAIDYLIDAGNPNGAVQNTDFRAVNFMIPEIEEVRKYSNAALFPAGLNGFTYESVMCPRESHFWGLNSGQIHRGYNAVGLGFDNGGTDPVIDGVYGMRGYGKTSIAERTTVARTDVGMARKMLVDAKRDVYGTIPSVVRSYTASSTSAWQGFLSHLAEQVTTETQMRTAAAGTAFYKMRTEIITQRSVFKLTGVGSTLYTSMTQQANCTQASASDFLVISDDARTWLDHR